jgi:hypothetical protein
VNGDRVVVDTNVGIIANGDESVDPSCELACVRFLRDLVRRGGLALDSGDRIFTEYRRHLQLSGEPGVGDVFMRWVATNRFNAALCEQVAITHVGPDETDFAEFPDDPALAGFDPSDRKFVAVAAAPNGPRPIHVAADRGWRKHETALGSHGVTIGFLNA